MAENRFAKYKLAPAGPTPSPEFPNSADTERVIKDHRIGPMPTPDMPGATVIEGTGGGMADPRREAELNGMFPQNRFAKYKAAPAAPVAEARPQLSGTDQVLDVVQSLGMGVNKGLIGLAGMPGDIADLTRRGVEYVGGEQAGKVFSKINPTSYLPQSSQIQGGIEAHTGAFPEPKSELGDYAGTIGEFAPAALAGPGGIGRKAAMTVIPAVASEAAGKAVEGSAAEPYVRAGVAIATGAPLAGSKRLATNKVLRNASKTSKAMQQAKNDAYTLAEETVGKQQIELKEFADIVRGMNKEAVSKGVGGALAETTDKLYSNSKSIISDMTKILQGAARGERPPPTYGELEKFRQTLNDVVEGSKDIAGKMDADGYLASRFISKLDDAIDKTPFQEARNAYKTLRKTQRIERAIELAETRSSSTDLAYKNEFKKIVRENIARPIFSKGEMEAIRQVAGHGRINNLLEGLGRAGFSSKSVTAGTVVTGAAAMLGPLAGLDPLTAAALTASVTSGSKAIGTRMTKAASERARNIVSQGGDNAALDSDIGKAISGVDQRRVLAVENARQQAREKRKPVRMKNGSVYWNPTPAERRRLIEEEGATPL